MRYGGIIHSYQKYDPARFPSPTQPPPDLVSGVFDHLMAFGRSAELTPEQLARAIRIDPSQISGLGPSLDALMAMLLERKRRILAKYETQSVIREVEEAYRAAAEKTHPPHGLRKRLESAIQRELIPDLERIWYAAGDDQSPFAQQMLRLIERLGEKYEVEQLDADYEFSGNEKLSVAKALEVKEELEKIDALLKQLEEAMKDANVAIIDMEAMAEFASPQEMEDLSALQQQVRDYLNELAGRQGIENDGGRYQLTPQAYRIFQGKLLQRIFSHLEASRTGRHEGPISGEGAVETQRTKDYEFGDSVAHMDITQSFINAIVRSGPGIPISIKPEDLVVHKTRNSPKCATVVVMDMSGSMRYDGQYINVKRMAMALDGLIRSEYPGDFLRFVEMYTFAKTCPPAEIVNLLPKPVTIHDPWVRLKADMSRDDISEYQVHPHFTNIQHALRLARQHLAGQDSPNRQVILITDGLPTAHFDDNWLYMLYPPAAETEAATMREAHLCARDNITINLFLVPSWSQNESDIQFAYRLAESTKGRVFFTAGGDLDRYVVWDYLSRKREIIA